MTNCPITLTDSHIIVGNGSNQGADVAMSGDVTINDTGVTTIKTNVALAGSPTTTTQSSGDNSTKIATTAFVANAGKSSVTGQTSAFSLTLPTKGIINSVYLHETAGIQPVNFPIFVSFASFTPVLTDLVGHIGVVANSTANGNLNATYNNGASGVGATLTNAGTQAALVINGVSVSTNDRVCIAAQTSSAQNGIYTVTNVGSGSTNWVLTRATDFDQTSDITKGAYFYSADLSGQVFQASTAPATIGTSPITFISPTFQTLTYSLPANGTIVDFPSSSGSFNPLTTAAGFFSPTVATVFYGIVVSQDQVTLPTFGGATIDSTMSYTIA